MHSVQEKTFMRTGIVVKLCHELQLQKAYALIVEKNMYYTFWLTVNDWYDAMAENAQLADDEKTLRKNIAAEKRAAQKAAANDNSTSSSDDEGEDKEKLAERAASQKLKKEAKVEQMRANKEKLAERAERTKIREKRKAEEEAAPKAAAKCKGRPRKREEPMVQVGGLPAITDGVV